MLETCLKTKMKIVVKSYGIIKSLISNLYKKNIRNSPPNKRLETTKIKILVQIIFRTMEVFHFRNLRTKSLQLLVNIPL